MGPIQEVKRESWAHVSHADSSGKRKCTVWSTFNTSPREVNFCWSGLEMALYAGIWPAIFTKTSHSFSNLPLKEAINYTHLYSSHSKLLTSPWLPNTMVFHALVLLNASRPPSRSPCHWLCLSSSLFIHLSSPGSMSPLQWMKPFLTPVTFFLGRLGTWCGEGEFKEGWEKKTSMFWTWNLVLTTTLWGGCFIPTFQMRKQRLS